MQRNGSPSCFFTLLNFSLSSSILHHLRALPAVCSSSSSKKSGASLCSVALWFPPSGSGSSVRSLGELLALKSHNRKAFLLFKPTDSTKGYESFFHRHFIFSSFHFSSLGSFCLLKEGLMLQMVWFSNRLLLLANFIILIAWF